MNNQNSETPSSLTDEMLVAATLEDKQQFAYLVERYEDPIARYLRRLGVGDIADVEDLLQEIFIKTYRNLPIFDQRLRFSSWLYRIAHNEAVSWFRKKSVRPEGHYVFSPEEVLLFTASDEIDAESKFVLTENQGKLQAAISELSPKYQEVILLRFFEQKDYEEISDILRLPTGTVGTLLRRGKEQLKQLLANQQQI